MLKGNKGVTLVALVITIIVLLILAAVSISLVVGDNGVLSNATKSVDETNRAYAETELEMAISSVQTDFFVDYLDNTSLVFTKYCTADKIAAYLGSDYTLGSNSATTSYASPVYASGDTIVDDDGLICYVRYKDTTYAFCITTNNDHDTGATCEYMGYWDEEDSCWATSNNNNIGTKVNNNVIQQ